MTCLTQIIVQRGLAFTYANRPNLELLTLDVRANEAEIFQPRSLHDGVCVNAHTRLGTTSLGFEILNKLCLRLKVYRQAVRSIVTTL